MKSILFEVPKNNINTFQSKPGSNYEYEWHINIPLLPAFSITHFSIQANVSVSFSTRNDRVQGDFLIVESEFPSNHLADNEDVIVVLNYHGIRDYSLLFPWINNTELKERVGLFYEEAEKSFETESWLSLSLMCGGVFEGMLYEILQPSSKNNTFSRMIELAQNQGILTVDQCSIMNRVRDLRNLVHGNKYNLPYISRKEAMDIRSTLDQMIKDVSLSRAVGVTCS
ncbi:DUF4145 domain-containing protein [Bacillus cereus]|uniref:DUF4145 domain-containing protein n=1 Tax=Bacillus cereus TaxID=1396 RepID=UPI000BFBF95A|nr:DUF4145 domain-containing protein [Bacillus cereus]PGQ97924.1 DUF4145 domain-containing protein [Bacillus cereus]